MKKNNLHKFIANICMILFFSGIVFSGNVNAQPPGWSQIRSVTITENSGANLSNYQLRLIIDTQTPIGAGQMLANGDDIRFGTTCSGNTPLNYWIEGPMNSPSTVIWVKVPSIPANGMATIFMYFGNPLATSTSAIPGTFIGPHSSTDSVASGGAGGIGNSQRGFRFAPITDVLVESFGKRTPNNTTRYVTLFDFASQAILRQMQVAGPSAVYTYSSLASPIWLTPGTQYLLELFQGPLDNSYYFGTSSQIGQHLTYIDMKYCNSCTQNTFPTSTLANYHYGYPDFWYFTKQSVSPAPTFAVGSVVLPSLVASSNSPVNVGATINLSASNGFSSYSWSGPNAYSSNSQNPARPLASVPDAGVYTVIGVTANGCSATASTNVIVNSAIPAAALNFDGINDYVNLPSTPILGNQFTIECWINSASGADGLFHGIIGIPTNIGFNRPPSLYVFNGTRIHGGFGDGTNWNQFTTGSVITPNTWNHLAMTFNGTTLTLYVNGVSAFTTNAYAGRTPISVPITNIGRLDNYFQGSIDEVRFWNRASCQGAILNNMNCEIPGAAPGLIGNYHFNQGLDAAANPLVTTLIDASASGNNGTLTNMALNGPTSNWIAPGAVPSGVSCSAFVDNVPPVITCPPTVTANILPNSCAAPVSFTATATDLCSSPVALSYSPASGSSFNGGNTTVVATATDGSNNAANCSFTVRVIDNEAPVIVCPPNITVNAAANSCDAYVAVGLPTITDNCANVCAISDNLDAYSLGAVSGQSPRWAPWPGGLSSNVSTIQALSPPNSLRVTGVPRGGPEDQLFLLGNQTSGVWNLSFWMFVPLGNTGYYNLQHFENPGVQFAHQAIFNSNGTGRLDNPNTTLTFGYPQGQWFEVRQTIDQTLDQTTLFINGVSIASWQFSRQSNGLAGANSIGGFDFYPITGALGLEPNLNATPLFYIDNHYCPTKIQ